MKYIKLFVFLLLGVGVAQAKQTSTIDSLINQTYQWFIVSVDSAEISAQHLVDTGKKESNVYAQLRGYYYLGYIYVNYKEKPLKGLIYYLEAIKTFEINPDPKAASDYMLICMNTGTLYKEYSHVEIAERFYFKSLAHAFELNDFRNQSILLMSIGKLYGSSKSKELAYAYADSAIKISKKVSDDFLASKSNDAGILAQQMGDYELAIQYFNDILIITDSSKIIDDNRKHELNTYVYENIGVTFTKNKDLMEALIYLQKGIDEYSQIDKPKPRNLFNLYFDMGEAHYLSENYDYAIDFYMKAIQYTENYSISGDIDRLKIFEHLSISYEKTNQLNKAVVSKNQYQEYLENYLLTQEKSALENQKLNIDLITQKYFEDTERTQSMQSTIFWISIGGGFTIFLLLSTVLGMVYQKYKKRKILESELRSILNSSP